MKKTLLNTLTFVSLCIASVANAQVGIGVPAGDIHPSAELEVKSTEKGFLLPRMTKAQRIAIGSPATGLIVYQTDGDVPNPAGLYYFDGLLWKNGIGAQGIQGPIGAVGPKGDIGSSGPQGIQGLKGDTGSQGPVGPAGANGTNGAQGLPGAQGIQGKTGDTGAQGPQGPAGVNGTNGTPGAKGDTGDQGIQGPKGDKGDVGATGPQGEVGPAGPKGDPGTSTGATPLTINSTVANTNNRLSFTNAISGSAVSSLQTSPSLTFNPSTGNLSAPTFTGNVTGNLTGNASSASQVAVSNSISSATNYLSFSPSTNGVSDLKTNPLLTFNPSTGTLSALTFTGSLVGNASSASGLEGGAAGAIPYQSGVGTTSFIPGGTAGQVLTSNGVSAPSWKSSDSFYPLNFGGDTQNSSTSSTKYFVPQGSCHEITYPISDIQTKCVVAITGELYSITWSVTGFSPTGSISIIRNGFIVYTSQAGIFNSPFGSTGIIRLPVSIKILAGDILELSSNDAYLGNCQFQFAIKVFQ